ncbi:hypothetical protein B0E53_02470 [Micromonospora sp. MH33]|uniref:hypothetical protein n=1 Tax=Micromonospora sp. MH33 TaxID=1945509 RepID=UPI000D28635F|nr:hypothetical protein [Micromonospora sp. MH33]PSK65569.1 hypothetical protein B0E53_02470 [Micromonospora sp. MH33]
MARHGGRATTPGSGTGAPTAGTPDVSTTAAPHPAPDARTVEAVHEPGHTSTAMIALANRVCANFAAAEVARAMAERASSEAEHAHLIARAEHWEALVNEQWNTLCAAICATVPDGTQVQRFLPVRPLTNGHVELHVHDTDAHRHVVLFTGAQALAVGTHLTAYGALSLDRSGQKLDPGLPHIKAAPPFADGTTEAWTALNNAAGHPPHTT